MYYCFNCGIEFEEPINLINNHGFNYPPFEHIMGCPNCRSDDIEKYEDDEDE